MPADRNHDHFQVATYEVPLPEETISALIDLWETVFEHSYRGQENELRGEEKAENRDVLFVARMQGCVVGSARLITPRTESRIAGLAEVATAPEARGKGIASKLCQHARDWFLEQKGQAIFLGTSNPAAARIYRRLGWQKLAGSNVMAYVRDGESPEAFLVDFFREISAAIEIASGSASDRIPMIPLIVTPHNWQVMDANIGIYSTRYVLQPSCMGLYPRYQKLTSDKCGNWFAAHADGGRVVGLGTARLDSLGGCQVDGFTHHLYPETFADIMKTACKWAGKNRATRCWAKASEEDEDKITRLEMLGFEKTCQDAPFILNGKEVDSVRLERRPFDAD